MESSNLTGRVLVLEDDYLIGSGIKKKLEQFGLVVEWATTRHEAIAILERTPIHGIVSDIYIDSDKEQGLSFVEEASAKDIPVIIVTCNPDLEIAKRGLNAGAQYIFEKPLEADDIVRVLRKAWEEPKFLSAIRERFFDAHRLTAKEKNVARLLLKGFQNKEIAELTTNSLATIKFHLKSIYSKCYVKSRTEFFNCIFPS